MLATARRLVPMAAAAALALGTLTGVAAGVLPGATIRHATTQDAKDKWPAHHVTARDKWPAHRVIAKDKWPAPPRSLV